MWYAGGVFLKSRNKMRVRMGLMVPARWRSMPHYVHLAGALNRLFPSHLSIRKDKLVEKREGRLADEIGLFIAGHRHRGN